VALSTAPAALAVPNFTPQQRVGYTTGDQWEPALAADGHGHIYIFVSAVRRGERLPGLHVSDDLSDG